MAWLRISYTGICLQSIALEPDADRSFTQVLSTLLRNREWGNTIIQWIIAQLLIYLLITYILILCLLAVIIVIILSYTGTNRYCKRSHGILPLCRLLSHYGFQWRSFTMWMLWCWNDRRRRCRLRGWTSYLFIKFLFEINSSTFSYPNLSANLNRNMEVSVRANRM